MGFWKFLDKNIIEIGGFILVFALVGVFIIFLLVIASYIGVCP
jgi:UPF0716 family protein affecting phage T7 exclusion